MIGLRVAFVLWDGAFFGGAETATIALCKQLSSEGHVATVVFVGEAGVYVPVLQRAGVPHVSLQLERGSHVLRHPRRFAQAVRSCGPDASVIPTAGFMARSLRLGGYTRPIVAVEHGGLLQYAGRTPRQKARDVVDRGLGLGCVDAQVAVSNFLRDHLERVPHAPLVRVIYNGVDVHSIRPRAEQLRARRRETDSTVVIGSAGKLMRGKGFPDVLDAAGQMHTKSDWCLRIAGQGELLGDLQDQARSLGIEGRVEFVGWVDDMTAFWAGCDVAVAASNGCVESFGMTVAEAFASGIPAVVSESGGLTEVLGSISAGESFSPGDFETLSRILCRYVDDAEYRLASGEKALARAQELSIAKTAAGYEALISELARKGAC